MVCVRLVSSKFSSISGIATARTSPEANSTRGLALAHAALARRSTKVAALKAVLI